VKSEMERSRKMSIISFQPTHTLFELSKKNPNTQMDESHSSIQGATGDKVISADGENPVSGGSVQRQDLSN
jgi:hypothetical protein